MRIFLASAFVFCGVAAAEAQSFDIFSFIPNGGGRHGAVARQVLDPVIRYGRQAAAAEKARAAAEARRERRVRLASTAAGRKQLAREDASARRAAERQRRQVDAIVRWAGPAILGGGGGGSGGGSGGRTYNEAAADYSACKGHGGSMCSSQ